jgi:Outer membrane efflux protein
MEITKAVPVPIQKPKVQLLNPKPTTPPPTQPPKPTPNTQTFENPNTQTSGDSGEEVVDPEEAEQQSDAVVPKTEQNPLNKPNIDQLIEKQFNDDMWRIMRGSLPCLETTAACLEQLQSRAIAQSPLLKELDTRISEANQKINEAKSANKKSIRLGVLSPALQYLLGPAVVAGQTQPRGTGLIDNILGIISGNVSLINGLIRTIGIPLFEGTQGGNGDAQRNAIAISDLQIKVAELQRGRAQLADTIREKTAIALVKFDEARTDFQTSQIVAARVSQQFQVYEIRYVRGNSDTESYLGRQNSFDKTKAQVYGSWAKMRRALFQIKLIVLSVKDAEI